MSILGITQRPNNASSTQPTELAEDYLGNVSESADVARRVMQFQREGRCLEVTIERSDRAKGRILTQSQFGQPVGIVKARDWLLREGDVLSTQTSCKLVLVSLQAQQVMALRFEPSAHNNHAMALVRLGHALGNQHWPVTLQGEVMYVELVTDAHSMETTLLKIAKTIGIHGLQISFEEKATEQSVEFETGHGHEHKHEH